MSAGELDFLEALDRHSRDGGTSEITSGAQLRDIAANTNLDPAHVAYWTGLLVDGDYLRPGPLAYGVPELPAGVGWSDSDLDRRSFYRLTPGAREEAERVRRYRRERATDSTMAGGSLVTPTWLHEDERGAISRPLHDLQAALDSERWPAAIGAAKDLVEAAAKVTLRRAGVGVGRSTNLPALVRQALEAFGVPKDRVRSLTTTVQHLAEVRNTSGSGHGRAAEPLVAGRDAHLAAGAASTVATYLLDFVSPLPGV